MVKHIEIPEPQAIPLYEVNSREEPLTVPGYRRREADDSADRGNAFQRLAIGKEEEPKKPEKEVSTWKLISVTIALCFAMFCVSLVSERPHPQGDIHPFLLVTCGAVD